METGTLLMVVLGVVLFVVWWLVGGGRRVAAVLLAAYGLLNLIGGGIISVLPLEFLPFEPEQALAHYLSHVIYGIAQLPLIWLALREARNR